MKTNEEIVDEFVNTKDWYKIQTIFDAIRCGRPIPVPSIEVLENVADFLRTTLEAKDKECEERVRDLHKSLQDNCQKVIEYEVEKAVNAERRRIVTSNRFFVEVDEDNVGVRKVLFSDITPTKDKTTEV